MMDERELHHKRHERFFRFASFLTRPVMRLLYRYRYEPIPRVDGPVFVLCNHNTDFDSILLGDASPRQMYYVATETVTRMGVLGKLVMRYFDPILHYKGSLGAGTTRAILGCLKTGRSVALFPEGNRSFNGQTCPIPPATAKIARTSGATLVTYRFTGGYLSSPRWGRGIRKGRLEGHVIGVYSPEQLKAMSVDEVRASIERDLWTDAYAEQASSPVRFRGRARAEHLESMLFLCPQCGALGMLRSKKHTLSCACGAQFLFTEEGFLRDENGREHRLTELDDAQRRRLAELAEHAGDEPLFSDRVLLRRVGAAHRPLSEEDVSLTAYRDRFAVGEQSFAFDALDAVSIVQRNRLQLRAVGSDVSFEFTGAPSFNALKYLYLYRLAHPSASGTL